MNPYLQALIASTIMLGVPGLTILVDSAWGRWRR